MQPSVYVERMHGFESVARQLAEDANGKITIRYGDMENAKPPVDVFIKSPRTQMDAMFLAYMEQLGVCSIGFIGRHLTSAIDPANLREKNGMHMTGLTDNIPVSTIDSSPLSSAVAAYVYQVLHCSFAEQTSAIQNLTISSGNTFEKRIGHEFREDMCMYSEHIAGKTIGVLGCGDIGKRVMELLLRSDAKVFYTATSLKEIDLSVLNQATYVSTANELTSRNDLDALTIHLPPNVTVSLAQLQTQYLVHTAHHTNTDEQEVLELLRNNRVNMAVIDVFCHELDRFSESPYYPKDDDICNLIESRRALLTPHIAYLEKGAITSVLRICIEQALQMLRMQN